MPSRKAVRCEPTKPAPKKPTTAELMARMDRRIDRRLDKHEELLKLLLAHARADVARDFHQQRQLRNLKEFSMATVQETVQQLDDIIAQNDKVLAEIRKSQQNGDQVDPQITERLVRIKAQGDEADGLNPDTDTPDPGPSNPEPGEGEAPVEGTQQQ